MARQHAHARTPVQPTWCRVEVWAPRHYNQARPRRHNQPVHSALTTAQDWWRVRPRCLPTSPKLSGQEGKNSRLASRPQQRVALPHFCGPRSLLTVVVVGVKNPHLLTAAPDTTLCRVALNFHDTPTTPTLYRQCTAGPLQP
ncbi:hypothetical protein O3P69_020145 [Scylla paramamosain]|uniref:Uncharacterized protein n=1 Tax=Scylla paramamosain TaxID=85552 RepID=A0AAW0TL07_SCYPA